MMFATLPGELKLVLSKSLNSKAFLFAEYFENLQKNDGKRIDWITHHGQTVALQGFEHVTNCLFHVYHEIGCLYMF